jgi:hypothetical protein
MREDRTEPGKKLTARSARNDRTIQPHRPHDSGESSARCPGTGQTPPEQGFVTGFSIYILCFFPQEDKFSMRGLSFPERFCYLCSIMFKSSVK